MSTDDNRITLPAIRLMLILLLIVIAPVTQAETFRHERGEIELEHPPQRIVALNWAAAEALILLGVTPTGVADLDGYPVWVKEPAMPPGVQNVGIRASPSLEAIHQLKPDLIITSAQLAPAYEQLKDIAPTYVISVYDKGLDPFQQAKIMLQALGDMLDRSKKADRILADLERSLAANRKRLANAGLHDKPIALVSFMDNRHVRIMTRNGLLSAALEGLGLTNAWTEEGNFWGFSLVGLEVLAPMKDARLVVISPTAPGLADQLAASPFWQHLPMVNDEEIYQVETVWSFGGIHAVQRLAENLTDQLLQGGAHNVRR
ncbi:MAG: iron-siderophore ABC transporter substrate-binding protein [Marinobacter sp.]|uniref:iron-siderophore ABC transporter substrate-binding protein n=1 Tax=Marinobacter sp. TaxID=50741 RepID=UPI0034A01B84